ncbi:MULTISPECIES: hypothetical protein [Eikenella]|uniref:hypothetical protein n=1 Tax=Eikenella TaxID=538 RepID=UPI000AD4400C|nr:MULTISPECIES: hypothetical protein [Eikenella]
MLEQVNTRWIFPACGCFAAALGQTAADAAGKERLPENIPPESLADFSGSMWGKRLRVRKPKAT